MSAQESTVIDPVCGMTVDLATTAHRAIHDGREFGFYSAGCKAKFAADPGKYLSPTPVDPALLDPHRHHGHAHQAAPATSPEAVPAGAKWTCPMHPEIVRDGPGDCPICGMALEPVMPAAADTPKRWCWSRKRTASLVS